MLRRCTIREKLVPSISQPGDQPHAALSHPLPRAGTLRPSAPLEAPGAGVPLSLSPPASEPLPGQASRKLFCSSAERLPRSAFKTPVFSFCWSRRRVRSKEGLASFCPVSVLPLGSWLFPPYFSCLTQESQPGPSEMSHCRREREVDLDPQRTEEGRGHRPCSPACAHGSPASWRGWTGTGRLQGSRKQPPAPSSQ